MPFAPQTIDFGSNGPYFRPLVPTPVPTPAMTPTITPVSRYTDPNYLAGYPKNPAPAGTQYTYNPKTNYFDTQPVKTTTNQTTKQTQTQPTVPNSDDVNSIKSKYPGYASWNDAAAILADFKNTGGAGKGGSAPQDDYMNQIENAYNDASNVLNNTEAGIKAGEQDFYNAYTKPYDAQLPMFAQARDTGLAANQTQQGEVRTSEANAIAAARQLYNELRQGSQQRFGGGSSAGEVTNAILGREQMRNQNSITTTASQNLQKLFDNAQSIRTNYDAQVQSLEQQKQAALAQARDAFRQRIDAINNARFGLAQNKAAAKLQALQQLRNEAVQIQQQAANYNQSLQSMVVQADLNLRNALAAYQAQAGKPVDLSAFQGAQYSTLSAPQSSNNNTFLYGQIKKPGDLTYP